LPVSVIIPAFNAERFIEPAIRSLLQERETVALDIIVVDDGSTDRTREIVLSLARDYREIRLLHNPRKGIAAARNTGLDNLPANCAFVTFLDADDLSYPGRIARQRARLALDPAIDALYGTMEMFSTANDSGTAPAPGSLTRIIRGPYLQSSMYRPSVIKSVGKFDEGFRQGCDTDYVLRVIEGQFNVILDDGLAGYYRRHDANVTLNLEEVQREFKIASMRFAIRRRRSGQGPIPPLFSELFMSRADIEKDFGT
jgi:glycosyltransferase involved in cell wall biosynthesis